MKTVILVGALPLTATQMALENDFIYLKSCTVEFVTDCCYTSYEYKMYENNNSSGGIIAENKPDSCIGKKKYYYEATQNKFNISTPI